MPMARVSHEALDRWRDFADWQGVSIAALLEAMSQVLPQQGGPELDPRMVAVIEEARAIDVESRRRG
jgi:hypothetical protein